MVTITGRGDNPSYRFYPRFRDTPSLNFPSQKDQQTKQWFPEGAFKLPHTPKQNKKEHKQNQATPLATLGGGLNMFFCSCWLLFGEDFQLDDHIFQMGWNPQPEQFTSHRCIISALLLKHHWRTIPTSWSTLHHLWRSSLENYDKQRFFSLVAKNQLMVNCWFGLVGILGVHPSNNPFHKGIPGIQTTGSQTND